MMNRYIATIMLIALAIILISFGIWLYVRRKSEPGWEEFEQEWAFRRGEISYYPAELVSPMPVGDEERYALRKWWHGVLRSYGKYSCYATFLLLPSDKEAIKYLKNSTKEIDLLTGNHCLFMAFSNMGLWNLDHRIIWEIAASQHASEGYSVEVARNFGIRFVEFPCLVIFQDIRSDKYVTVSLKRMSTEQISFVMREVLSTVSDAATENKNPLNALQTSRNQERLQSIGKSVISEIRTLSGKTLETIIESSIKAFINP